ncbi:hypothetical protein [Nostocoides sp.]|uniref:hypothetical protein n=1 Tax=Nostocoides sp. TaxID=1917966 RepID=UPI003BB0485F
MALIVTVHGIGKQVLGPRTLKGEGWAASLADGVEIAGGPVLRPPDINMAFYGDLFRPAGAKSFGEQEWGPEDVKHGYDLELLGELASEAAKVEGIDRPEQTKVRTPDAVQAALRVLSRSRFFAGVAEHAMIWNLAQVRKYLTEPDVRASVQERVASAVTSDTRVIVGHSLGSVIAYEALMANPNWPVRALVTIGSPLGVPRLVFDRLRPAPHDGSGAWPPGIDSWSNIADSGDIVALVKRLGPLFGPGIVEDFLVHNGAKAHDATPYLTARETGAAIAAGLREP